MSKIVVIGAGASGIIAALKASEKNEVILLESSDKCGKKILLTGNGRCNYWNSNININNYQTDDINTLENILKNKDDVLEYLYNLGIYPKIKNDLYYPYSNQASSIEQIFINELNKRNIKIKTNYKVKEIIKNDKFIIKSDIEEITSDKLIIATGSKALNKTDDTIFNILKKFNHKINPILPSLVPLKTNKEDWNGVRCDTSVSLYVNDKLIKQETGEIQLTDYGVSGICIFNISSIVSKNLYLKNKVNIKINFLPTINNIYQFIEDRNKLLKNYNIEELLESLLPYKLLFVILKKSKIKKEEYWNNLNSEQKNELCKNIESFKLEVTDTLSYDRAQICTGGVSLKGLNTNMESKFIKNLYIIGEILDVDGICGGFNLAFAFITGYIAGSDICVKG